MSMENRSFRVAVGRPEPAETQPEHGAPAEDFTLPQVYHTPLIDIHEGPDGLILEADLPGATDDHVSIQLEDNVLSLHARVPSPAPGGARPLLEEYHVADFYRSFILSDEVDRSKITAELKNGVLRLMLPKAESARPRQIVVSAAS